MFRFMIGLSLASLSLAALASPYLAVGTYNSNGDLSTSLPMLAQSQDGGQTWSLQEVTGLDGYAGSYLPASDCSDTVCVTAGPIYNGSNSSPLLLQSQDGGNTWNFVSFTGSTVVPSFYSASCDQSTCVVSGVDNATNGPLMAMTTDGGNSWALNDVSSSISGVVFDLDCDNGYCVGVGVNDTGAMVAQSFDGGNTWAEVNVSGAHEGGLMSVDCNSTNCTAVGATYGVRTGITKPLLVTSSTDKSQWAVQSVGGKHGSGFFYRVSCNETTCAAAGVGGLHASHMQLATSTNGSAWTYENLGTMPMTKGWLFAVDCNDNFCAAVGENNSGNAVMMSNATGNWLVESNSTGGRLFHVNCDDAVCFAGGTDENNSPMLMQNTQGAGWAATTVNNAPAIGSYYSGSNGSSKALIK